MEEKVNAILTLLDEHYGIVKCHLNYQTDWQLLIATILSAQHRRRLTKAFDNTK